MDTVQTPPRGDYQKAESYISRLVSLIESGKLEVIHTDLQKFDPGSIQDHYRLDLSDYQIEISHSKLPNSGADSYVMLFTNLKNIAEGNAEKTILAYTQLSDTQFNKFKTAAEEQIAERKRIEEEKRFKSALAPIDDLLTQADQKPAMPKTESHDTGEPATHAVYTPEELDKLEFEHTTNAHPFMVEEKSDDNLNADNPSGLPKSDSNPYF